MSHWRSSMQLSSWIAYVRTIGVPTSATICGRMSSRWLASASLSCWRQRLRSSRFVDQSVSSNALRAAPMARSMSSGVPSATSPITASVAGLMFENALPDDASVSFPSMSMRGSAWSSAMGLPPLGVRCGVRAYRYVDGVRIAAFDLGTNSFHLLVADVHADGHFEPLTREKAMIRLGDVVSRKGHITEAAADTAVETVRRFRLIAEAAGATEMHACATSAIRRASNGDAVVDRIEEEAGVPVEVISGQREAELIFGAIRASVMLEPAPALCFDLGGGSLEVMVGDAGGLQWATSENLGVGALTAEFVSSDPISKDDRRQLRAHLVDALTPVSNAVAVYAPKMAVGSSGTLEDLGHMVAARRGTEVPLSLNQLTFGRDEFLTLHKDILSSTAAERLRFQGVEARRVDLIPAGSMFLATAMELFDFDELTVSE